MVILQVSNSDIFYSYFNLYNKKILKEKKFSNQIFIQVIFIKFLFKKIKKNNFFQNYGFFLYEN